MTPHSTPRPAPVGIDQIRTYMPGYVLSLETLAEARGVPKEKICLGLGANEMCVVPPWEDTVTLGANAAARLFNDQSSVHREDIGLLLVATETAVDHAKPVSSFLHDLLELPPNCRTLELKHACYSGTAAVMMAADWTRSGAARGRKALVVMTDIARYDHHSSAEFTQGAGAVALLISEHPDVLQLDPISGVFARHVYDFWRPLERRTALVDGKLSIDCYLEALDGALGDYRVGLNGGSVEPLTTQFDAFLYHTPFPKMAYKAHGRLMENEWRRMGRDPCLLAAETARSYAAQVDTSLGAARRVGNTYTASLYMCLAWLAEQQGQRLEGKRIALFSYGSGCCAEFFSGCFTPGSSTHTTHIGLGRQLDTRREVTVEEYERFADESGHARTAVDDDFGLWHLAGVRNEKRLYERATA